MQYYGHDKITLRLQEIEGAMELAAALDAKINAHRVLADSDRREVVAEKPNRLRESIDILQSELSRIHALLLADKRERDNAAYTFNGIMRARFFCPENGAQDSCIIHSPLDGGADIPYIDGAVAYEALQTLLGGNEVICLEPYDVAVLHTDIVIPGTTTH